MRFEGTKAYVATDDLKVAVNAAITLERPLLVKGEPGHQQAGGKKKSSNHERDLPGGALFSRPSV